MRVQVLDWVVCPLCGSDLSLQSTNAGALDVDEGELRCSAGDVFSVRAGVPRLTPADEGASRVIRESFSREWGAFDYTDRTWAQTLDDRCKLFLQEVGLVPEDLDGKLLLDAGCGNGSLSAALTRYRCEVLATDVSDSVETAHRHFVSSGEPVHFVQADLLHPPFRPATFDVVYSSGVLHHTKSTRGALDALAPAVAPGGVIYIWLYWRVPGARQRLKQAFRKLVAPLPSPLKYAVVRVWLIQSLARQRLRRLLGPTRPEDQLNRREVLVGLLDHYTPRYRWEHTPEEVHQWYRELGFTDIETTEEREWGFGVKARRPLR